MNFLRIQMYKRPQSFSIFFFVLKYCSIVRRMRLCIIFLGKQILKNMISSLCLCCRTNYLHLNVTELDEGG